MREDELLAAKIIGQNTWMLIGNFLEVDEQAKQTAAHITDEMKKGGDLADQIFRLGMITLLCVIRDFQGVSSGIMHEEARSRGEDPKDKKKIKMYLV